MCWRRSKYRAHTTILGKQDTNNNNNNKKSFAHTHCTPTQIAILKSNENIFKMDWNETKRKTPATKTIEQHNRWICTHKWMGVCLQLFSTEHQKCLHWISILIKWTFQLIFFYFISFIFIPCQWLLRSHPPAPAALFAFFVKFFLQFPFIELEMGGKKIIFCCHSLDFHIVNWKAYWLI